MVFSRSEHLARHIRSVRRFLFLFAFSFAFSFVFRSRCVRFWFLVLLFLLSSFPSVRIPPICASVPLYPLLWDTCGYGHLITIGLYIHVLCRCLLLRCGAGAMCLTNPPPYLDLICVPGCLGAIHTITFSSLSLSSGVSLISTVLLNTLSPSFSFRLALGCSGAGWMDGPWRLDGYRPISTVEWGWMSTESYSLLPFFVYVILSVVVVLVFDGIFCLYLCHRVVVVASHAISFSLSLLHFTLHSSISAIFSYYAPPSLITRLYGMTDASSQTASTPANAPSHATAPSSSPGSTTSANTPRPSTRTNRTSTSR
jgi:hypothetical protein